MNAAQKIDRIEPTNWYVGMKNPSVQLMVYGKDIRSAEVSTNYPGVKIDSLVRLDSPNYLLVYMNIKDAQPGTMKLCFKTGKNKTNVNYELKARDMKGEDRQGCTNASHRAARTLRSRASTPIRWTARSPRCVTAATLRACASTSTISLSSA